MKRNAIKTLGALGLALLLVSGCAAAADDELAGTGFLSAAEVAIAPELSGRVASVEVREGEAVTAGQVLFRLDAEIPQAQRDQAAAAVDVAEAALTAARAQAASAQAQYDAAVLGARAQDAEARAAAWKGTPPKEYRPAWYYQKAELLAAAQREVDAAQSALDYARADLEAEQRRASSQDFVAAEARLAAAQGAYTTVQATYAQAKSAGSNTLLTAAQERLDAAKAELDAARLDYEHMLTSAAAESVVMARARVAVARATLDNARDALLRLQTGDDSPQVTAARAAVAAAEAAVGQAEAGRAQAVQALRLAEAALERTAVAAPADGVVLARNLEAGEIAVAGGTVMRVAPLDTLELVVYLPEDRYGRVLLGDRVSLTVDSYPAQAFGGTVVHIADEAEFTPRNVQTEAGRKATVYAVKIAVANPGHLLKPGMPADVTFPASAAR